MIKQVKNWFKKHKFLRHSICCFIVVLFIIYFESNNIKSFFIELVKALKNAAIVGGAIYILSVFSGWLLWPVLPKYEDFKDNEERDKYFRYKQENKDLLWLYIYLIIVFTIVFLELK